MATLEYKSAVPFMPQGSEFVTKLIVVMPDGTTIDDVLPYIGSGKGKRLTTDAGDAPAITPDALRVRNALESIANLYRELYEGKSEGLFKNEGEKETGGDHE